ncbi:hypothetical protein MMC11_003919 [Xylographa trunciseda]|nr:hypothetical protein [Xylographa trunciseda]
MLPLLLLSLLPLALTTPLAPLSCPTPSSFLVSGFNAFTAAPGPTGISAISFTLYDSLTNVRTLCQRELSPGSGRSPVDPDHFYNCANSQVQFLYSGSGLALTEEFVCGGDEELAAGNSTLSLDCYSVEPPYPLGNGTLCETPFAQFGVPVSSVTTKDGMEKLRESTGGWLGGKHRMHTQM